MGFFSNLGDAFSGKIYKQNTLVGNNVDRLIKKVETLPQSNFIRQWVYCCTLTIDAFISNLLFEDEREENKNLIFGDGSSLSQNPFKQNLDKLDEQKVYEIFKLLCGYHLTSFLQNKNNVSFLKKVGFTLIKFEEEIFSTLDFTRNDEKTYYELKKKFKTTPAGYSIILLKEIFKKAFDMSSKDTLGGVFLFSGMISKAHSFFYTFTK